MFTRSKAPPHLFDLNDPAIKHAREVAERTRRAHFIVRNGLGGLDAVRCDLFIINNSGDSSDERVPVAIIHPEPLRDDADAGLRGYQMQVLDWVRKVFGDEVAFDRRERACRVLEEALELAQSAGVTVSDARELTTYTYGRPVGDPSKEVGDLTLTLAAFCGAADLPLIQLARDELQRVQQPEVIEKIRAKQATKPGAGSPLPGKGFEKGDDPDWDGKKPIKWTGRFRDALKLLTGEEPPLALARNWAIGVSDDLQDWVGNTGGPWWCQNIAIIDAATTMADQPIEGRPDAINYAKPARPEHETEAPLRAVITDAKINAITEDRIGRWPSFEAQAWACRVAHAVLREVYPPVCVVNEISGELTDEELEQMAQALSRPAAVYAGRVVAGLEKGRLEPHEEAEAQQYRAERKAFLTVYEALRALHSQMPTGLALNQYYARTEVEQAETALILCADLVKQYIQEVREQKP